MVSVAEIRLGDVVQISPLEGGEYAGCLGVVWGRPQGGSAMVCFIQPGAQGAAARVGAGRRANRFAEIGTRWLAHVGVAMWREFE
jgi:hypothetical protein